MKTVIYKMDELIKEYYDLYIASICKERQLPDMRDGMRIVQRRLFWTFYELGVSRSSFNKSAFIIGDTLKLHPHGDSSCYGSLGQEVNSNAGLLTGKGNWGSDDFIKIKPAAMRYTECKFSEKADSYFEFAHLSELVAGETDKLEPKFIPVPIPYALISGFFGLVKNVGRTKIPPYKAKDLISRLEYLIGLKKAEPVIKPYYGCDMSMEGDFKDILTNGKGCVTVYPTMLIDKDKGVIEIKKISPDISNAQTRLNNMSEDPVYGKEIKSIVNASSKETSIIIEAVKNAARFDELVEYVKKTFTININYNIIVYRDINDYPVIGVDTWLKENYERCKKFRLMSLQGEINNQQAMIDLADAILLCRPLITKAMHDNPIMSQAVMTKLKSDSLSVLNNNNELLSRVYSSSINKLLSADLDTSGYKKNIKALKALMKNDKVEAWVLNWLKEWSEKEKKNENKKR